MEYKNCGIAPKKIRKILVCPDSFKGSLTAEEARKAIEEGLRVAGFRGEISGYEMSDGGEGFAKVIAKYKKLKEKKIKTYDPLGREIVASYFIEGDSKAYLESASVIGLELLDNDERNPMKATSGGLGKMIKEILKDGVKELYISLGGSAVVDGGMGMLSELGMEFLNEEGKKLIGNGKDLSRIRDIRLNDNGILLKQLKEIDIIAVSDVDNPLLGDRGAVKTFAIQKGAKPEDLVELEAGMKNFSEFLEKKGITNSEDTHKPGAGAAGGVGYALRAALNSKYESGIDFIKKLMDFESKIKGVDLVITGEGSVDSQSLMGKVLSGILCEANKNNVRVITFAGRVKDKEILLNSGVTDALEISDKNLSESENMKKEVAYENLKRSVEKYFRPRC